MAIDDIANRRIARIVQKHLPDPEQSKLIYNSVYMIAVNIMRRRDIKFEGISNLELAESYGKPVIIAPNHMTALESIPSMALNLMRGKMTTCTGKTKLFDLENMKDRNLLEHLVYKMISKGQGSLIKHLFQVPVTSKRHVMESEWKQVMGFCMPEDIYSVLRDSAKEGRDIDNISHIGKVVWHYLDRSGQDLSEYHDFIDRLHRYCMTLTMKGLDNAVRRGDHLQWYLTGTRSQKCPEKGMDGIAHVAMAYGATIVPTAFNGGFMPFEKRVQPVHIRYMTPFVTDKMDEKPFTKEAEEKHDPVFSDIASRTMREIRLGLYDQFKE